MSKDCSVWNSKALELIQDPKVSKFNDFLLVEFVQETNIAPTKPENSGKIFDATSSQHSHDYQSFKNIDNPSLPCLGDAADFFC